MKIYSKGERMEAKVFVKIDGYKDVLDTVGLIKEKLAEAKDILSKMTELKNKGDQELAEWNSTIAAIESKIEKIDNALLEPESV